MGSSPTSGTKYGTIPRSMKVAFACSSSGIGKYTTHYKTICETIKNMGHIITRDWMNEAIDHVGDKEQFPVDWKFIYHDVFRSILACDVAVFEKTISSFATGYQISLALERRKPTLLLFHEDGRDYRDTFAAGIESDLLTFREYNLDSLEGILKEFLRKNATGGEKTRFNFFIDKNIENYLDWAAYTYGKSKSTIVREFIIDNMLHRDERYRGYLKEVG